MLSNKKAYFDYNVEQTFEAGIMLTAGEVKSIQNNDVTLLDSFAKFDGDVLVWYHAYIKPYANAETKDVNPYRPRTLLLKSNELRKIKSNVKVIGTTVVPLALYRANSGKYKLSIGVCTGKKLYDKRQSEKDKQTKRELKEI